MRQVGKSKKDSRKRSDSVSTAIAARRDNRGSLPYSKIHTNRGGRVRGNTEISQNGEEAFHYRWQATYAGHLAAVP